MLKARSRDQRVRDLTDAEQMAISAGIGALSYSERYRLMLPTGYAFGYVNIPAIADTGSLDQTTLVQSVLNSCQPGETAVLPPVFSETQRYVRCGNITLPSGVNLESAGSSPIGWNLGFSPSISQAFNSRVGRIWMKQSRLNFSGTPETGTSSILQSGINFIDNSKNWAVNRWKHWLLKINSGTGSGQVRRILSNTDKNLVLASAFSTAPDNTSVYSINCNISTIVLDGIQMDGTDINHSGASSGNALEIGNLAFDIKMLNSVQVWNYGGWGLAMYGNTDKANNTGTAHLATGVFITADHMKIFNCGGAGTGGAILLKGGPQDGASFHAGTLLLDHCQQALVVDDSISGVPANPTSGSGGIHVSIDSLRCELNGKVGVGAETPSITNIRGNVHIKNIWYSSAIATNFYNNIHHRFGQFSVDRGRMVKGGTQTYGVYCDAGKVVRCGWVANYNYDIGLVRPLGASDTSIMGMLATLRFQIVKTAGGITVQHITTGGGGFGAGHGAGDQFSTTVSGDITNGGATVIVGNVLDRLYYQLSAGGGLLRIQPALRTVQKVLSCSLLRQTASIANLTVDVTLINGNADFTAAFRNGTGAEVNLNTAMTAGQAIDFSVMVALNET